MASATAATRLAAASSVQVANDAVPILTRHSCRVAHSLPKSWLTTIVSSVQAKNRPWVAVVSASAATSTTTASTAETFTSLKDLPALSYINPEGYIRPPVEAGTKASVFAVIDNNNRVQYIGFSKDIRNSLRTLMGRRPELCHYYKLLNLPVLDQPKMLAIRQQWITELGAAPRGNSDPTQRSLWEKPVDAGSISDRAKNAAATSRAKTLNQMMRDKGLKEEMVYNPELLEEGKCDVLPSRDLTEEELAAAAKQQEEEAAKRRRASVAAPTGELIEFDICYDMKFPTNGGWMYDISITYDNKESSHRVILGRIYPEAVELPEDQVLEITMAFLLSKKVVRHTEGVRTSSVFPINYFAVGQVEQRFEDFKDWFHKKFPTEHWNFRRINSYGPAIDTPAILGPDVKPVEF